MNKLSLYFNTLRYLRFRQLVFQLWYRIKPKSGYSLKISGLSFSPGDLQFNDWIEKPESFKENTFSFLNKDKQFPAFLPDWNFTGYGMLWNYNLNYMDYLLQSGMDKETGFKLISHFIENVKIGSHCLDPYPVSLRGINWVKFFSRHKIHDSGFESSLYQQYRILFENPEYHLMGNHLLENGFSLLFGAFYFKSEAFYNKAKSIVETELAEQILNDGGHFELSPMYHQIILDRLLDCINLVQYNTQFNNQGDLLKFMKEKASLMLQWLNAVSFSNGEIPLFNDSANGIAPSTKELNKYASRLEIAYPNQLNKAVGKLKDSGFRRYNGSDYVCITDTGRVGPSYQPGHAHADSFSFELYSGGNPLVVDTGVSTYEKNERRQIERSTCSHNTVQIGNNNSSEVWDGFRVARRAKVVFSEETNNGIRVRHNGYGKQGVIHERQFISEPVVFSISDNLIGKNMINAVSRFHFHPKINITAKNNHISFSGGHLEFENAGNILVKEYLYAPEFNVLTAGKVVEVSFDKFLKSTFYFS